ncbi:MAG: hypothetical protein U0V73_13035 [Acidimicrobiia bacterium]
MTSPRRTLLAVCVLLAAAACSSGSKPTVSTGPGTGQPGGSAGSPGSAGSSGGSTPGSGVNPATATTAKLVTAYVTTGLIPKGTTGGEAEAKNLLQTQRMSAQALPEHVVTDLDTVRDRAAVTDIGAGKFLLETDFAPK